MNRLQRRLFLPTTVRPTAGGATEPVRLASVMRQGRGVRGTTMRSVARSLPRRSSFVDVVARRPGASSAAPTVTSTPMVARRACPDGGC